MTALGSGSRLGWALVALALMAGSCAGDGTGEADAPSTSSTAPVTTAPTTATAATATMVTSTRRPRRAPVTAEDPLRVVLLGDSVAYDAAKGIDAALTATGVVHMAPVRTAFGGVGLNPNVPRPAMRAAREIAAGPEVDLIVVMLGSWDHLYFNRAGSEVYTGLVKELAAVLADKAPHIVWLGEPPSAPTIGEDELQQGVNASFRSVAARVEGIDYVALDRPFTRDGVYDRYLDGPSGRNLIARKGDGRHICPAGAAIVGAHVLAAAGERWELPAPDPAWVRGEWWDDPRYHTPPGVCEP